MSYQFGHVDPNERLNYAEEPQYEEELPPRRNLAGPAMILGVMALFAGGLWFAYVQGTRHPAASVSGQTVPLLRADERPAKVRPDQPGGMAIPDQNI